MIGLWSGRTDTQEKAENRQCGIEQKNGDKSDTALKQAERRQRDTGKQCRQQRHKALALCGISAGNDFGNIINTCRGKQSE